MFCLLSNHETFAQIFCALDGLYDGIPDNVQNIMDDTSFHDNGSAEIATPKEVPRMRVVAWKKEESELEYNSEEESDNEMESFFE